MITSNLVVEGVPGNHHHHHHPHHHHHALVATGSHPLHSFSAIHHHLNHSPSSRTHLMSASTFAEPFLKAANGPSAGGGGGGSLLQPSPPEFAHPLPKPAPLVPRYNGVTSSSLNGAAKPPPSRLSAKYPPPEPESSHVPVNLVQSKDPLPPPSSSPQQSVAMDVVGHPAYGLYTSGSRLYQPNPTYPPHFAAPPPPPPPSSLPTGPYGPLYPPNPFTPLLHRSATSADGHRSSHLLALQQYPETSATPPHHLKSPPQSAGHNGMLKTIYEPPIVPIVASEPAVSLAGRGAEKRFKVPSGKEGSLKHRILTRPEPPRGTHKKSAARAGHTNALLPPPSSSPSASAASSTAPMTTANLVHKNGLTTTLGVADAAPAAIVNASNHTSSNSHCNISCNNGGGGGGCAANTILPKFIKGSLIQLADGSTKKVEDMQTEDFISCVENSTTMRIDPSTVVRIQESAHRKGMTTVTLSYGEQRNQVDVESSVEHPYFVVKRGWSSCMPNKTLQIYRLSCHQLQVGDVCLTLSPKAKASSRKSNAGGGAGAAVVGAAGQRRPNGQAVDAVKGPPSTMAAAATKKNDLKLNSAADADNDDCRSSSNGSSSSNSGSCNSTNSSSSGNSSSSCNGGANSHSSSAPNGSHLHQLHQLASGAVADGKFGRVALVNGHEEAKKMVAKAAENDDNNNSNCAGDKYETASAKKKRRWSAPEQIGDEYQPPSVSPLASPTVSVAAGGVAVSKNNV